MPALLINYFGQGALVLSDPSAIVNPFYRLFRSAAAAARRAGDRGDRDREPGGDNRRVFADRPGGATRPAAALQGSLGLGAPAGQIYLPRVNRLLLIGVVLLVLLFRTSSGLASAYGIAVSTTMVVDGIMGFVVVWKLWNWRAATAAAVILPFVVVDMSFFAANLFKLLEGA